VVLGLLGLGRIRSAAERLLSAVALALLVPVVLSPADSPRNLAAGLVPLLLLAGARLSAELDHSRAWLAAILAALALLGAAVYGVGTVVGLQGRRPWAQSSVVPAIMRDAAGWHELGPALRNFPGTIFALDYSIASQIWYYAGRPAYTSWGQYRMWGIPEIEDATIVSLDYLPSALVSDRLEQAFWRAEGPEVLRYDDRRASKEVRIWEAEGLRLGQEAFLNQFDFLTLLEASR
jgi:hypothetical protein